jgi:subtilase family serine protease
LVRHTLAATAACATLAVAAAPASASSGLPLFSHGSLLGLHVDLGCANPANRLSLGRLLPAIRVLTGGTLRCFAQAVAHGAGEGPALSSGPTGLQPAQIQSAYKLAGLHPTGRTVAIVDAFDDPNAEADLAAYRSTFGLPACTSANGCFTKVNQSGATSPLPAGDAGWGTEISLDLDAVSAACPDCHIVLVEANSAGTADLMAAERTATARPFVNAVSNSWGGAEDNTVLGLDSNFSHQGVAITASSGDSGYGVSWPASSQYVTGVGGTTLSSAGGTPRGWSETAWSGSGSGCSAFEPQLAWQPHVAGCSNRTVADVSADADPNSGLAVYDTYASCGSGFLCDLLLQLGLAQGLNGWAQVGGTSLSSPLIASVYALAGNTAGITNGSFPYSHTASLFDVTSGSNGTCSPPYLCTAGTGYDGPTGLGTPNGTGGF